MYKVINKNFSLRFIGKGKTFTMTNDLDLFDSLGGTKKGFLVLKA
jgi:hypothetical protein